MALTASAKVLSPNQVKTVLTHLSRTRLASRNRLMFLLSVKAGLRAKEIANLSWRMVLDSDRQLQSIIELENKASKGKSGGRGIPMNTELREAFVEHLANVQGAGTLNPESTVFKSERGNRLTAQVVTNWFFLLYKDLGFDGCSSHSGRRTFITNTARKISSVGGSLRDIQMLAGHSSIATTQRYIDFDADAMKKVVNLI